MYVINFVRGFFMAVADSVPGVSGGTIAFIMGFYDKFINSINNLISGSKEERIEAIKFLAKIGIGWVTGMVLSVLFITSVFEEHIYVISSLFLGLIIMAIPLTDLRVFTFPAQSESTRTYAFVWSSCSSVVMKSYSSSCTWGRGSFGKVGHVSLRQ